MSAVQWMQKYRGITASEQGDKRTFFFYPQRPDFAHFQILVWSNPQKKKKISDDGEVLLQPQQLKSPLIQTKSITLSSLAHSKSSMQELHTDC